MKKNMEDFKKFELDVVKDAQNSIYLASKQNKFQNTFSLSSNNLFNNENNFIKEDNFNKSLFRKNDFHSQKNIIFDYEEKENTNFNVTHNNENFNNKNCFIFEENKQSENNIEDSNLNSNSEKKQNDEILLLKLKTYRKNSFEETN